jgi:hypothetical protein
MVAAAVSYGTVHRTVGRFRQPIRTASVPF